MQALTVAQLAVDAVLYGTLAATLLTANTAYALATTALKGLAGCLQWKLL